MASLFANSKYITIDHTYRISKAIHEMHNNVEKNHLIKFSSILSSPYKHTQAKNHKSVANTIYDFMMPFGSYLLSLGISLYILLKKSLRKCLAWIIGSFIVITIAYLLIDNKLKTSDASKTERNIYHDILWDMTGKRIGIDPFGFSKSALKQSFSL
jgi:hypothetical protein